MSSIGVSRVVGSRPTEDGEGVRISRLTGFSPAFSLDPFLMLDEIRSDDESEFAGGFPPHPHRGFETITLMLRGGFSHTDSMNNHGEVSAGGAQWMTAASGVIHSEMPKPDRGQLHGFQFWLNLPASEKMLTPAYRDISASEMTRVSEPGMDMHLLAGTIRVGGQHCEGVVTGKSTEPLIAVLETGAGSMQITLNQDHTHYLYVHSGSLSIDGNTIDAGHLAYLDSGSLLDLECEETAGALLFGGRPIGEPIVHQGPFVMNTQAEITQAIMDYRNGTLVQ